MGGCLSLRKRNNDVVHIDQAVLDDLNRRCNALQLHDRERIETKEDYVESPYLTLLNRRLLKLQKPLEDTSSINDEEEWEEALKNEIKTLEGRLGELCAKSNDRDAANDKNLKKKEIDKLKLAEEKLLEFEVRFAKLQKPIILGPA